MKDEIFKGVVKFFLPGPCYGFIVEDISQKEYYFHITGTQLKSAIQKGAKVSFKSTTSEGDRVKAINVIELK